MYARVRYDCTLLAVDTAEIYQWLSEETAGSFNWEREFLSGKGGVGDWGGMERADQSEPVWEIPVMGRRKGECHYLFVFEDSS